MRRVNGHFKGVSADYFMRTCYVGQVRIVSAHGKCAIFSGALRVVRREAEE